MIGAGSFGTALAVLLARGGLRTTLQTRTAEQATAARRASARTARYLPGVELPAQLRIEPASAGVARADYVFLAVPSRGLGEVIDDARRRPVSAGARRSCRSPRGSSRREGLPPTSVLSATFGAAPRRLRRRARARAGDGARGRGAGRGVRATRSSRARSRRCSRAPASCASSPTTRVGVELAGAAKNAAALAAGATEAQGLNAAGAAAGHIFAEVWRYAEGLGARPESMIGLAGAGDLVATALARESRNRRAGELLAAGVPAAEIPARIGQAVEALESVPLLARALRARRRGGTRHERARAADLGRAAARRLGRAGARDRAAAGAWRRRPQPGFWRRRRGVARSTRA